jgi:large subunit ribosomal protein L7/L12
MLIMAKLSNDELIEAFKELTLIELADFVKLFEETFDVTAAAPVAVAVAGGAAAAEAVEEKTAFNVVLDSVGDKKIGVIKVAREITGLGLKEAKELVEKADAVILEGAKKEDAEAAKKKLEEAGATVKLV